MSFGWKHSDESLEYVNILVSKILKNEIDKLCTF